MGIFIGWKIQTVISKRVPKKQSKVMVHEIEFDPPYIGRDQMKLRVQKGNVIYLDEATAPISTKVKYVYVEEF